MSNFYGFNADDLAPVGYINYYGGDGRDFLQGGAEVNHQFGGEGDDVLAGAQIYSPSGDGTLDDPFVLRGLGPSGNDYLEGGPGRDVIWGSGGNDTIYGGDGNDSGAIAMRFAARVARANIRPRNCLTPRAISAQRHESD